MLENEVVILREITVEDTDNIIKWKNCDSVKNNFCIQEDLTRETHMNWLNNYVFKGITKQFIIYSKELKKDVGSTFIKNIDPENRKGEFGIFIGEDDARGRGIGYNATKLITDYGFQKLNLHKIFLRVLKDNVAGQKTYCKAGYIEEGIFKDEIKKGDSYKDLIFMAKLNEHER